MRRCALWAITSYYNPIGYSRRLANYRVFRHRLSVPLVTVELSYGAPFQLGPGDADILVQRCSADILWQKERLLNVAWEHLPDSCEYVAWLDCDVIFDRPDWDKGAIEVLRQAFLCQPFRSVHHLNPDADTRTPCKSASYVTHQSFAYACNHGLEVDAHSLTPGRNVFKRGNAWCMRRSMLGECGLYDRNVIGGGDVNIAFAAIGRAEEVISDKNYSPGHARDYRRWATGFYSAIAGRVGYVDGDIFHLWHGNLEDRRYQQRHDILRVFDYDPASDITLDTAGCWRWNSSKPDLHRQVREYFLGRQEDGRTACQPDDHAGGGTVRG